MACKNLTDVFDDIQSINTTSSNAQLEGVLCHGSLTEMLEPHKRTQRYFRGQVSDGSKKLRLTGFEEDQLRILESFNATDSAIKISHCEVQKSLYSGYLEVKLTNRSTISKSSKKFESSLQPSSPAVIDQVSQIHTKSNYDLVNLQVKVLLVDSPSTVSSGKRKQDVTIGDASGIIKFTVEVDKFQTEDRTNCNRCLYAPMSASFISQTWRQLHPHR